MMEHISFDLEAIYLQNNFVGSSLFSYIIDEVKRDYLLEYNEKKLRERRKRVYTVMKTPRELEKVSK